MSEVWERSDRAVCTHPGWPTLRGWARISASFYALFEGDQHLQFILTDESVELMRDTAWVTVDENVLGERAGGTVAALNLFVRRPDDGSWRMVAHHASTVQASFAGSEPDRD